MRLCDRHTRVLGRVIVLSWVLVLACALSPLLASRWDLMPADFTAFLVGGFATFYLALYVGQTVRIRSRVPVSAASLERVMLMLLTTAVVARMIDRFYLRRVGDVFSIASVRSAREAGSNLFSIYGAVTPAIAIVLFSYVRPHLRRRTKIIGVALIGLVLLDVFFSGSRGSTLVIFLVLAGHLLNVRRLLAVVVAGIPLSGIFYVARFQSLTGTTNAVTQVMFNSSTTGYATYVPISPSHYGIITDHWGRILGFPLVQSLQYISHGLFEFASFYPDVPSHAGAIASLLPQIPGLSPQDAFAYPHGVYYSLLGTLALAFGQAAILAAAVLGLLIGFLYRVAIGLGTGARTLMLAVVGGAPIVNTIGGYDIVFYLIAIAIVGRCEITAVDRGVADSASGAMEIQGAHADRSH